MLWMETYFLYCSVRLGVMVISVFGFLSTFISSIIFFITRVDLLQKLVDLFDDNEHSRKQALVEKFIHNFRNNADTLLILLQLYLFSHMAASVLAFYGAWKIKKYYIIPLAIFEFFRVIYCLITHILVMSVYKYKLNLGVLITATLGGGFLILYFGYNWATIVALYQVITLINSTRYKSIYGDDPFKPLIPKTYNPLVADSVRVLITPLSRDIDEQKMRNMTNRENNEANGFIPPIISVMPRSNAAMGENAYKGQWKWKRRQGPIMGNNITSRAVYPSYGKPTSLVNDYNDSVDYNYWQWSELAPKISARNKRNLNMGANWKY